MEDIKQNEVVYADERAVGARDAASQAAESVLRAQQHYKHFNPKRQKAMKKNNEK